MIRRAALPALVLVAACSAPGPASPDAPAFDGAVSTDDPIVRASLGAQLLQTDSPWIQVELDAGARGAI